MKKIILSSILVVAWQSMITTAYAEKYQRIISTAGNYSEIIAKLDSAKKLIAVDTTSYLPKEVMDPITKIGYRRNLSAEGIISLNADVILLAPDAGPPAVLEQIKLSKADIIHLDDNQSAQGVIQSISEIAKILAKEEESRTLINEIEMELNQISDTVSKYPFRPKIAFLMGTGDGKFMGMGNKSAAHHMIDLIGGENVFINDFINSKPVSIEGLVSKQVDVILLAQRDTSLVSQGDVISQNQPEDGLLNKMNQNLITQNNCYYEVDIFSTLGWGPSFANAANKISSSIYECIK